jgi:type I restriction enzyme, S subunit
MEVKPGYKRTEVGIIPQDWEIRTLSQLAEKVMVGIASAATYAYRKTGVPLFRNQNIRVGILDDKDLLFIAPEYEKAFKTKRLRAGDLITMRTGYPGITAIVPERYEAAQSFTTLITRPKRDEVHSDYLCLYINSQYGRSFFESSKIGGAQKNVNVAALRKMPVILSALGEQRAIAEALNDVNNLLNNFDQLLAKKRDLKQAAMQQLLTGQSRLPGFSKAWRVKQLGDLIYLIRGGIYGEENPRTPLIPCAVATTAHIEIDDTWNNKQMPMRYFTAEKIRDYATVEGDLIVVKSSGSAASIQSGKLGFIDAARAGKFVFSNFLMLLRPTGVFPRFLYFYLCSHNVKKLLPNLVEASTYPNIRLGDYLAIEIPLPTHLEQTAIAAALSDMDAELDALLERRAKIAALKQGMMQELLTGRTRLV